MTPTLKDASPATARLLPEAVAAFISAPAAQLAPAFSALMRGFKTALQEQCYDDAAKYLRLAILPTLDYTRAQTLFRLREDLRNKVPSRHKVKVAVVGSVTTKQLIALLDLFLFAQGVDLEVYEGDFGVFRQEILDSNSGLYEFEPQVVFLATTRRDVLTRPDIASGREAMAATVEQEVGQWRALWEKLNQGTGAQVIQNNFDIPPWRVFGNHESRQPAALGSYLSELNRRMAEVAPSYVTIHDIDYLATLVGRWQWSDSRFFHQAKLPCPPESLVQYAGSVAALIAAQLGLAKKCLVLDLDNTVWGGVIGDDGLAEIRLGQGDAEGEAFLEFQSYARSLKERGILLAVCSKNTHAIAMEAFEKHTEMILRPADVSCFVANWQDKATNLRTIAKELNIGTDSLVFVDDNPAERAIVRQLLPEVAVPELPEDVTGYIRALEQHRYFPVLSVATEDFQRTEFYKADTLRREIQTSTADMDSFLQSLEMKARIGPITPESLERSAQLIQRSNQFNLTTRRHSAAELGQLMENPAWLTCTVSLKDKFGDNGLISVVLAKHEGDALEIDTWLMSCRVLKRGVEKFVLNHLARHAIAKGLRKIRGTYIPSPKNSIVKDHYASVGFLPSGNLAGEATQWELVLTEGWAPSETFIATVAS